VSSDNISRSDSLYGLSIAAFKMMLVCSMFNMVPPGICGLCALILNAPRHYRPLKQFGAVHIYRFSKKQKKTALLSKDGFLRHPTLKARTSAATRSAL
jgi:hypothetical protein